MLEKLKANSVQLLNFSFESIEKPQNLFRHNWQKP